MKHRRNCIVNITAACLLVLFLAGCAGEQKVLPGDPSTGTETGQNGSVTGTPDTVPPAQETPPSTSGTEQPGEHPPQNGDDGESESPTGSTEPEHEPEAVPDPKPEPIPDTVAVTSQEDLKVQLERAIQALEQPPVLDISAMDLSSQPELDVKNTYYALLSEHREYCYAYDLQAAVSDGRATVEISYMPYITGQFPTGFQGIEVDTLTALIDVAERGLGREPQFVRVTNTGLTVDQMNWALQQVGGGYINCTLNRDATAIQYAPAMGFTMEECLELLDQCDTMAAEVVSALAAAATEDEMERARAVYGYLTETVVYDQRYYSDRENMAFHAQTAYGALHDGLAICGGYSHALKLLMEQVGLVCYNVSGSYNGEYHMWCVAKIDGTWLYFDATADRGTDSQWWRYCGVEADLLFGHTWDPVRVEGLLS